MPGLLGLFITIAVAGLIIYLIFWALAYLGAPEPIRKVVTVVVVVIAVVWILGNFLPGTSPLWWHR